MGSAQPQQVALDAADAKHHTGAMSLIAAWIIVGLATIGLGFGLVAMARSEVGRIILLVYLCVLAVVLVLVLVAWAVGTLLSHG